MTCPYCGREMKAGSIQSAYQIEWTNSTERFFYGTPIWVKGSIILGKKDFFTGAMVPAYLCTVCKTVLIRYEEEIPV